MSACSSCGKEIIWAITDNGKRMPIDPDPDAHGNVRLSFGRRGEAPSAKVLGKKDLAEREEGAHLYRSHWATCDDADRFRGRRRQDRAPDKRR